MKKQQTAIQNYDCAYAQRIISVIVKNII